MAEVTTAKVKTCLAWSWILLMFVGILAMYGLYAREHDRAGRAFARANLLASVIDQQSVAVVDENGVIVVWTEGARRTTGLDMLGKQFEDLIPDRYRPQHDKAYASAFRDNHQGIAVVTCEMNTASGERLMRIAVQIVNVNDHHNAWAKFVPAEDIVEIKAP